MVRFGLVGADVADQPWVGDLFRGKGYVGPWDEVYCVGDLKTSPDSL